MANQQTTLDEIEASLADGENYRLKKMFGGCALYKDEKVIALIDDDELFVKITPACEPYMPSGDLAPPYPGAKDHLRIPMAKWSDTEWLNELFTVTANSLPTPVPKKKR